MKAVNIFKNIFLFVLITTCLFGLFQVVQADQLTDVNQQLNALAGKEGANLGKAIDPRLLAAYIIQAFIGVIGVVFVGYMVYAGYILVISGGNEEEIGKAKRTILYSVIGLAIVLSAYSLTWFVSTFLTQATTMSPTSTSYYGIENNGWQTEKDYDNPCAKDPLGC